MPLSAAQRRNMPASKFALPGKGEGEGGKGPGAYPLDTLKRARNALSRGSEYAAPSALEVIRRRVHEAFPSIDIAHHNDGGYAFHRGEGHAH